ncbi:hypothetical protein, partial [Klebsiella sp. SWET4]|uniref:hypothetical protein n=1 Tax=Klebsiella sp. SWET4 TaxID=2961620 RepID=UPI0020C8AB44
QQSDALGSVQGTGRGGVDRLAAGSHRAAPCGNRGMTAKAITIAILAMGGEGGGVLADWLVDP